MKSFTDSFLPRNALCQNITERSLIYTILANFILIIIKVLQQDFLRNAKIPTICTFDERFQQQTLLTGIDAKLTCSSCLACKPEINHQEFKSFIKFYQFFNFFQTTNHSRNVFLFKQVFHCEKVLFVHSVIFNGFNQCFYSGNFGVESSQICERIRGDRIEVQSCQQTEESILLKFRDKISLQYLLHQNHSIFDPFSKVN